jgi:hypothetical protein
MGKRIETHRVLVGKREKGDHLEDSGIDGRIIILKWIFEEGKWFGDLAWFDLAERRD